jgi:two-component system, LytTR family, sensor kinase
MESSHKYNAAYRLIDIFSQKNALFDMLKLKRQKTYIGLMLCFGLSIISLVQQYFDQDREKWTFFIIPFFVIFLGLLCMWFLVFQFLKSKSEKPYMYRWRNVANLFLISVVALLVFSVLGFKLEEYFFGEVEGITLQRYISIYIFRGFFLFGLVILFKYLIDNREMRQLYFNETQHLREANTRAQFEILKQQINPHFLFNALSTLKSLIRLQDPNAEAFVMNLSDVYRKLLQGREKEFIRLQDEMDIVQSYLFMQKMRFEDNLNVETAIEPQYQDAFLPPFALQLLIENAIKHNIISRAKPLTIRIFTTDQKRIVVENTFQSKVTKEESTGWGLSSLKERFNAFSQQPIEIVQTNAIFSVSLPFLMDKVQ